MISCKLNRPLFKTLKFDRPNIEHKLGLTPYLYVSTLIRLLFLHSLQEIMELRGMRSQGVRIRPELESQLELTRHQMGVCLQVDRRLLSPPLGGWYCRCK